MSAMLWADTKTITCSLLRMLRYKITREDCAGICFLCSRSLAPAAVVHDKRLKMMVGDEQTDTSVQTRRKSLLTLDQQHSSSDIFVSISGLIGIYEVDFVLLTCDVFTLSLHFLLRSHSLQVLERLP